MSWRVLGELGLEYGAGAGAGSGLDFPVALERAPDGSYLIVDEIGLRKNLTVLTECRTMRVDRGGRALFDSLERGMGDAFGCLAGDGMALLRRTSWELQIVSPRGKPRQSFDLSVFTPHMPRLVASTPRDTFLVACLDHVFEVDILELDRRGRLLWFLPRKDAIGCPTSVQLLANDHLLVADEFGHVAVEVRRDGTIAWRYGRPRRPSRAAGGLSNPMGARQLADGRRLIADTRNHRVLEVGAGGDARALDLGVDLCCPTYVQREGDGHTLVCDAGNERVLELDGDGRVVWQYGDPVARRRSLSFPRSVELDGRGRYLVADTGNDRVVTLGATGAAEWPVAHDPPLFWPRCARRTANGRLLVADGRNSRILEVTPRGRVARELGGAADAGDLALDDPHDVRELPGGRLLITDPGAHRVVEMDWSGRVTWVADGASGVGLKDPHSAQRLADRSVLVSDTANSRLLWVDAGGRVVRELVALSAGARRLRLDRPRYAEAHADGSLLVVDSGNNRILAAAADGELIWELSEVPGSRLPRLKQPRWAQLVAPGEVVVSDHSNHRIVRLRHQPGSAR